MKVYIDLIFILNCWLDFLILLSVSLVLKRNIKIKKIILSSLLGSISTFFLFFNINYLLLIILKLLICTIMCIISFNYNNFKYLLENIIYFYLISIILGGLICIIKSKIYISDFVQNFLILIILSPIILYFYYKKIKKINNHYNHLYNVDLYYDNNLYNFIAFLDTGNKLYDQYKRRPIILIYSKLIKFDYCKGILVPYETANGRSIIKCLEADKIIIDKNIEKKHVIFGLVNENFKIENVNMILHSDLMGG